MAETWWLIENDDGSHRQVATDGSHPSTVGEVGEAFQMSRRGDLTLETANAETGLWSDNMVAVRERLIRKVDEERQAAQDALLSHGDGKKLVYVQKNAEQLDYYLNGATPALRDRFPAAYAEMDVSGEDLATVIAKFKAGAEAANQKLYTFDALFHHAKKQIQDATTASEAEAAASVDWS
jgi:hypothetical protein